MKKLLLFFALALCPAAVPEARAQAAPVPTKAVVKVETVKVVPGEVFDAELKDLDDGSFYLSNYRGQVFVLNFWASWCGPCRLEIPELNKLYEEYSARGVEFVGLTTERPGAESAKVREFARQFKMAYKLGWADPDVGLALMSGNSVPQTLVVAPDGRIVVRFRGYSNIIPQLLRDGIERALAPPPAPPAAPVSPAAPDASSQPPAAPPPPAEGVRAPETSRPPGA